MDIAHTDNDSADLPRVEKNASTHHQHHASLPPDLPQSPCRLSSSCVLAISHDELGVACHSLAPQRTGKFSPGARQCCRREGTTLVHCIPCQTNPPWQGQTHNNPATHSGLWCLISCHIESSQRAQCTQARNHKGILKRIKVCGTKNLISQRLNSCLEQRSGGQTPTLLGLSE
jgi:hypothetical protein